MSKFKVKANLDNVVKTVELERGNVTFEKIREQIAGKHGIPQFSIQFVGPSGNYIISNDQQLQKAIKESEKAQNKNIEVKVLKGYSAPAPAPAATAAAAAASAPRSTSSAAIPAAQPAAHQPAVHHPAPAAPSSDGKSSELASGELATFHVPADTSSNQEKITINPTQQADCFIFSTLPSKFATDVVVTLEPGKLTYQTTHSYEIKNPNGDITVQTVRGSHGFGLPFNPRQDQVHIIQGPAGTAPTVKLYFR